MPSMTPLMTSVDAERDDQPEPLLVLEGLAAEAAYPERVVRPDDGGDRGADDETAAASTRSGRSRA